MPAWSGGEEARPPTHGPLRTIQRVTRRERCRRGARRRCDLRSRLAQICRRTTSRCRSLGETHSPAPARTTSTTAAAASLRLGEPQPSVSFSKRIAQIPIALRSSQQRSRVFQPAPRQCPVPSMLRSQIRTAVAVACARADPCRCRFASTRRHPVQVTRTATTRDGPRSADRPRVTWRGPDRRALTACGRTQSRPNQRGDPSAPPSL